MNIEWLEYFFQVEEYDYEVLSNSKKYIINKGGKIFFAELEGNIIGTIALMPTNKKLVASKSKTVKTCPPGKVLSPKGRCVIDRSKPTKPTKKVKLVVKGKKT